LLFAPDVHPWDRFDLENRGRSRVLCERSEVEGLGVSSLPALDFPITLPPPGPKRAIATRRI